MAKQSPRVDGKLCKLAVEDGSAYEIVVDLGRQTRVDSITPRIVELRRNRTPWKEIAAITGVSCGNAANYYKRYVSALNDRKDTSNLSSFDATFSQVPDSSGMRDDCPDSAD